MTDEFQKAVKALVSELSDKQSEVVEGCAREMLKVGCKLEDMELQLVQGGGLNFPETRLVHLPSRVGYRLIQTEIFDGGKTIWTFEAIPCAWDENWRQKSIADTLSSIMEPWDGTRVYERAI